MDTIKILSFSFLFLERVRDRTTFAFVVWFETRLQTCVVHIFDLIWNAFLNVLHSRFHFISGGERIQLRMGLSQGRFVLV